MKRLVKTNSATLSFGQPVQNYIRGAVEYANSSNYDTVDFDELAQLLAADLEEQGLIESNNADIVQSIKNYIIEEDEHNE